MEHRGCGDVERPADAVLAEVLKWHAAPLMPTREIGDSRIYAGIHYRTATDVGIAMGKQVGELTVQKFLQVPH